MTSKTANSVIRYLPERVVGVVDHVAAGKTARTCSDSAMGFRWSRHGRRTRATSRRRHDRDRPDGRQAAGKWQAWLGRRRSNRAATSGAGSTPSLVTIPCWASRRRKRPRDPRRAEPPDEHRGGRRAGPGGGADRPAHGGHRLQRRQDDRAAAAHPAAQRARVRTRFVATGQTGIFIEGWGIAVDAVVADFIAGAAEWLVLEGAKNADIVMVEGQGSINHPGYSGVTLGLLHGSCPDAMILCHQASRYTSASTARRRGSRCRRSRNT